MGNKILRLYFICVLVGMLTGAIGSLFQLSIIGLDKLIAGTLKLVASQGWPAGLVSAFLSMTMVFIAWLAVQYIAPEAAGSGVPDIEGTLLHVRPIFWRRLLPVKFFGGILALSGKMVMGREGPTIQIGGNLGSMVAEFFSLTKAKTDVLIAAGSAAGLATAFNAPLAGVIFIMEEMRNQFDYTFLNFKMVLICSVTATITLDCIMGSQAFIRMDVFELPSVESFFLFFIYGILIGFVGLLFDKALMAVENKTDKLSFKHKRFYVLLIGFVVGYLAYLYPPMVGGGEYIIEQTLAVTPSFVILCLLVVVRFLFSVLSYSSGVPGGIFAPLLSLGTLIGLATFHFLQWLSVDFSIHAGMFAVAGMGALFAAVVRAPVTGVVLIVEMTQNYSLILPLMITCITSTTVVQLAHDKPIYTQLLDRLLARSLK